MPQASRRDPGAAHKVARHRLWIPTLLGIIMTLLGAGTIVHAGYEAQAYGELSSKVARKVEEVGEEGHVPAEIDWRSLREINADVVAWVRVSGTDIDLPVMGASVDEPEFYLHHDLWKREVFEGVPFLDHRCSADDPHRLAYGHHLLMGGQFSSLQHAYEQDVFDGIGPCSWFTPRKGETRLAPLCAMSVDMGFGLIQKFDWAEDDMHAWLGSLCRQASARSPRWRDYCERATSVITLVTCSSDLANQRWRTLVIFVESGRQGSHAAAAGQQGGP